MDTQVATSHTNLPGMTGKRFPLIPVFIRWYLFWLAVILFLYWPGILIFPKKDHSILMLGRHLVENDFRWFLDMLSYNRTRILQPGDYFLFRPVHLGIVALEDILFRYNFMAQGIICCSLFAIATTAFFQLARILAGTAAALVCTLLWASQLAGAEIVLWQHITPYVLTPAGICMAIALVAGEKPGRTACCLAGTGILISCFSHEIGAPVAIAMAFLSFLYGYGGDKTVRNRVALVFLVPAALALLTNILDYYVIHPAPSLTGPDDIINEKSTGNIFNSVAPLAGAIGIAVFSPWNIHPTPIAGWFLLWPFTGESKISLTVCAVLVAGIVAASICLAARAIRREKISLRSLSLSFFLLLFLTIFTTSIIRVYTRGLSYMFGAPYYFSLFSFAISGMLALLLSALRNARLRHAGVLALLVLSLMQAYVLKAELRKTEPYKKSAYDNLKSVRSVISNNPKLCFQGMDGTIIDTSELHMWTPLFQDLSCSVRTTAFPLYLSLQENRLALVSLAYQDSSGGYDFHPILLNETTRMPGNITLKTEHAAFNQLVYGQTLEFTLKRCGEFSLYVNSGKDVFYGFRVARNTVYNLVSTKFSFISNTLSWDPGEITVTYRLAKSGDSLLLLGNGALMSVIQGVSFAAGEPIFIEIGTTNGKQILLSNVRASRTVGDLQPALQPAFAF